MKTWSKATLIAGLIVLTILLLSCRQALTNDFNLVESGVLTIGVDASYPPHTYLDPNTQQIVGLDVDLANEIGRRLGLKVKHVPIEWSGIIPALQAKRFDLITAEMHITPEREEVVDFSDVVFTSGHVAVVQAETTDISTPEDLLDKTLLVPIGTTEEQEARKYTDDVKTFPLLAECFRELQLGRGDAVIVELFVASSYVKNSEGTLKVATQPWTQTQSAFAFRQDLSSTALREAFNMILADMRTDGTYDEILSTWVVQVEE